MAAAAEVKRLVRAKEEEGSECAGRAESALVWQQLVGEAKDGTLFRLRAAYWQSASQADLASIVVAVVGVLVNEPVEQAGKTAAVNGIVVEAVEAAVVAAVVTVVAIAAETVQASVCAAGLEPEVVDRVFGVEQVFGDVDVVDVVVAVKAVSSAASA
jgi:hypothetical protein